MTHEKIIVAHSELSVKFIEPDLSLQFENMIMKIEFIYGVQRHYKRISPNDIQTVRITGNSGN